MAVKIAQDQANEIKEIFEKSTTRLIRDFFAFQDQKIADIKDILINFVRLQVDYSKLNEKTWNEMLPILESITSEATASPTPSEPQPYNPSADVSSSAPPVPPTEDEDGNPFGDEETTDI
jgi:hypothetical protein